MDGPTVTDRMNLAFYEPFHLGDNLWFILYANRALDMRPDVTIDFYSEPVYHPQLLPFTNPARLRLKPLADKPVDAHVAWAGDGRFFHNYPMPHRYERLYFDWFKVVSERAGIGNLFSNCNELVWTLPESTTVPAALDQDYDVLIVNSQPLSTEWFTFDTFDPLGQRLVREGHKVIATHPNNFGAVSTLNSGLDVAQLSLLSQRCRCIVGISNAPFLITANSVNFKDPDKRWYGVSNDGSLGYDSRFHLIQTIPELTGLCLK